jgi:hypothetical protein
MVEFVEIPPPDPVVGETYGLKVVVLTEGDRVLLVTSGRI